jgi:prolipoprotein diacylglyceryl transferase
VIGARLWHVATDIERFRGNWGEVAKLWEGGLGIPGGLLAGIAVGAWQAKRRGIAPTVAMTFAAPALALAQAIGRWGNYFNQELFGRATDLPWALEIDDEHLPSGFASGTTFHPTFLYESLWCLGLALGLLWIDKRFRPAPGQLMVMYVIGYGIGRFWVESLRIDPADEVLGMRFNQLVALVAVIGGVVVLAWMRRHPIPEPVVAGAGDGQVRHGEGGDERGLDEVVPEEVAPDESVEAPETTVVDDTDRG